MSQVWIVDDEPAICFALRKNLEAESHQVNVFSSAEPALAALRASKVGPDVVLMDVRLPGIDGIRAMQQMREHDPTTPVIVMTAFGDLQTAVGAVHSDAFDYLTKPFDLETALLSIRRALAQKHIVAVGADMMLAEQMSKELLLGASAAMQSIYKQIAIAANSDMPVCIEGERGTGKNLVATMIHRYSQRSSEPFLMTSPFVQHASEFEAELFGSVTSVAGASATMRTGLMELARSGTILVEEPANIPIPLQAKLLRALETRQFHRLGEHNVLTWCGRFHFATSVPCERLVVDGELLPELFDHLRICTLKMPPLRERREDIAPLVRAFLASSGNSKILHISDRAVRELERREWLGNVRELKLTIQRASLAATGTIIQLEDLPVEQSVLQKQNEADGSIRQLDEAVRTWLEGKSGKHQAMHSKSDELEGTLFEDYLTQVEPPLLRQVLERCHGNRAAAASLLGLHRSTLRQKMRRYGIE